MNPPKMPMHIGDLLRDTGHLRALLFGAYILLLMHHWSTGSLPEDDEQLSAIARLSPAEWRKAKPVLERFFKPGWVHGRVQEDLEKARASYEKRAKAGEKGGKAKAEGKQSSSNATAGPEQPLTFNQSKDTSSLRSDAADAADDPRTRLFREGLDKLAAMTGKGPDACRSFVGKCLKEAEDNAIIVLGLIEDAERNRVADPAAWIKSRLKPTGPPVGKPTTPFQQGRQQLNEIRDALGKFADGSRSGAKDPGILPGDSGERPTELRDGIGSDVIDLPSIRHQARQ